MTAPTQVDDILFLLRHLGQQTVRELADSIGQSESDILARLRALRSEGRVEPAGRTLWRLIPSAAR